MNYRKIYTLFLVIISTYGFSQTNMERDLNKQKKTVETDESDMLEIEEVGNDNEPFIMVEQMPLFGDCEDEICTQTEIMKFVARNFKYPAIAKDNGVEGRVILEFVVEKDGTVGRVKILRGVHPNLYQNLNKKQEKEFRKILDLNKEELQIWIDNVNNSLNMECIQVILNLPKFTPGTQIGKAVPVKYTLPIKCSLG
jgi:protein TonB